MRVNNETIKSLNGFQKDRRAPPMTVAIIPLRIGCDSLPFNAIPLFS